MAVIEILTEDIGSSEHIAHISGTFLPGGEEEARKYDCLKAEIRVAGPAWTEDNERKYAELYAGVAECLRLASEKKIEILDIPAVPAGKADSGLFSAATQMLKSADDHSRKYEYPKIVRFFCGSDEAANMFRTAYNFWIATDHDTRMEVPHRRD